MTQILAQTAENQYAVYGQIGALLAVVAMFLAALKFLIEKFMTSHKETVETIKTVSANCHSFQEDITKKNGEVMDKVSAALNQNSTALAINTRAIEKSTKDHT